MATRKWDGVASKERISRSEVFLNRSRGRIFKDVYCTCYPVLPDIRMVSFRQKHLLIKMHVKCFAIFSTKFITIMLSSHPTVRKSGNTASIRAAIGGLRRRGRERSKMEGADGSNMSKNAVYTKIYERIESYFCSFLFSHEKKILLRYSCVDYYYAFLHIL